MYLSALFYYLYMYPKYQYRFSQCVWRTLWFMCIWYIALPGGTQLYAQDGGAYKLNQSNILPSNKVYSFLQDKLGYLWIATEKGVVRYNGYEAHLYNKSEGLPTDDIWAMIDDNSGRVWLGGASTQMGYISGNKYVNAQLHNITGTIFPQSLQRFDSGIAFVTRYIGGRMYQNLCVSRHDTIFSRAITENMLQYPDAYNREIKLHINQRNEMYAAVYNRLYHVANLNATCDSTGQLSINRIGKSFLSLQYEKMVLLCGSYFVLYVPSASNTIYLHRVGSSSIDSIGLSDYGTKEPIDYAAYSIDRANEDKLFVYTATDCFVFNLKDTPKFETVYHYSQIAKNANEHRRVVQYLPLPLWDTLVATSTHGLFALPKGQTNKFRLNQNLNLDGYYCVGTVYDSMSYWWNKELKKLVCLAGGELKHTYHLKGFSINNVLEYGKDTLLLTGPFCHFFTLKNQQFHRINLGRFGSAVVRLHQYSPQCYYVISNAGLYNLRPNYNTDTILRNYIAVERFRDVVPDVSRSKMIAYNDAKLLVFDERSSKIYSANQICANNNQPIEKVCSESRYGNVFIKSGNDILFFDPIRGTSKTIPSNVIYRNATINVWKNYLIVLGDFGVSFFLISGPDSLSPPITFLNYKKSIYREIFSHAVAAGVLTVQTDAGLYTVSIPEAEAFPNKNMGTIPYRIVLQDSVWHLLNTGDTLRLANGMRIVYADVINPLGNGSVRIFYRFAGATEWTQCNGNEIVRPEYILPNRYYGFELYCEDDGWHSNIIKATVWVQPTWWQKRSTRYLAGVGGILLLIVVVVVSVAVTNRMERRAQQKKEMQMELELKAIYAQINPHFIFNALTSALLLIKKKKGEEAYQHLSKFSRLLRSYINSSRNKYTSIAEEVKNLTNYMELQQARFKDRFESIIQLEDTLDTELHIPSLLIQPFVENAINHGILPSERPGRVVVTFRLVPIGIECTVYDNGVGRHASRQNNKDRAPTDGSYGNILIKELIKVFNKYEEMKIDIRYEDRLAPDEGTSVYITIIYAK